MHRYKALRRPSEERSTRDERDLKASDNEALSKGDNERSSKEPPLPPRATAIFLGLWVAGLILIAFFVVPVLFASCVPQS